ncbi:MAG: gliding motility-associated C-terminal domain-containing protein, partial [Crocinitomicaceae bacterium]|nr:gliding motility-associated C-terminal domain-containing protein [Crocinitomicaceae bacterium]
STWVSQGVTDTIYPYSGLLGYTLFAAVIQEANCPYDTAYHSIVVLPLAITATPTTSIFEGDSIQLNSTGGISFNWFPPTNMDDPGIFNPVVWPEYTTTYFVEVTDINGCTDTASLTITVNPNITSVVIPNLLTPNGDAFNDVLQIPNIDTYPNNELIIFNGYGQIIFQASPYNNDWAATYLNAPVPDGTYYYVLNLNDPLLAPDPYQGVITIIGNE